MSETVVELRGEHKFPEEVAVVPTDESERAAPPQKRVTAITAYDFSRDYPGRYQFGITKGAVAKTLRELADDFENGKCLPQRAQVTTEAYRANYTSSVMILEFCQRTDQIEDADSASK